MAFSPLSEYSEGVVPEVGTASPYTICENIDSYKPIDVSGLKSAVSEAMLDAIDNSRNKQKHINDKIIELSDEWGMKFISINNQDLNIVDEENYKKGLDTVKDSLKEQKERCDKLVDIIVSKTEDVKAYLNRIKENNKKYAELKKELNNLYSSEKHYVNSYNQEASKENPNTSTLSSLDSRLFAIRRIIKTKEELLKLYESNKIDSPNGSWVLG